jgi:hypothetical protein
MKQTGIVVGGWFAILFAGFAYFKWLGPDPTTAGENIHQWAEMWGAIGNLVIYSIVIYWICRGIQWLYRKVWKERQA